jgi:hypothetical protein
MPCSFDPGGAYYLNESGPCLPLTASSGFGFVFHRDDNVDLHTLPISGLNLTACTLAVYASQLPSRTPTQDSLPDGDSLGLSGRDSNPLGFITRFLTFRFRLRHVFLLIQACLAHRLEPRGTV